MPGKSSPEHSTQDDASQTSAPPTSVPQTSAPRRWLRGLGIVLFNLAFFLVLAEAAALIVHFNWSDGKLYYAERPSGREETLQAANQVSNYRIHPHLGFTLKPSPPARPGSPAAKRRARANPKYHTIHNNHGFWSLVDYPYARTSPREYLVGIYGGSVAAHYARFEANHDLLAKALAKTLGREVEDITILNFAQGGYKQPQQLLLYSYFRSLGQELDLVINIDGFNEIALSVANARRGWSIGMPSTTHIEPLRNASSGRRERMLRARELWESYARTYNRAWGGEAWELTFAAGFHLDRLIYEHRHRRFMSNRQGDAPQTDGAQRNAPRKLGIGANESWLYLEPGSAPKGRTTAQITRTELPAMLEIWRRSSEQMLTLQRASGGTYLHFVQPNQYFGTGRVFGNAEKEVAFAPGSPFGEQIEIAYPELAAETERLQATGYPILGLFEIFDDETEAVYIDNCCHYTMKGQRLLGRAMARAAQRHLRRR